MDKIIDFAELVADGCELLSVCSLIAGAVCPVLSVVITTITVVCVIIKLYYHSKKVCGEESEDDRKTKSKGKTQKSKKEKIQSVVKRHGKNERALMKFLHGISRR